MPFTQSSRRLLSLALLSASGLFLEITLTRLLSTLFYPPYVFAILSLALLGIGLGAAAATFWPRLRQQEQLPTYLAFSGVSTLFLVGFAILTASIDLRPLLVLLLLCPYLFIGLALVTLFSSASDKSPQLYMADLVGAGLGALLVIPALNILGVINGSFLAAITFGIAGMILRTDRLPRMPVLVVAVTLFGLVSNIGLDWLQLDIKDLNTQKPIQDSLRGNGEILSTVWDSFARTDLVDPGDGGPYRLYMDGAAGSIMPPAGDSGAFLTGEIGFFPFATEQPDRVFIIGPGGGLDVWFGLQSGAEEIIAVEVNPASVELVKEYGNYNGHLYSQPEVQVIIDEGRSVLRRQDGLFDLIFLSQVITLTSERAGYALTENTVYTVEAFLEYLDHLAPNGQIALTLYDEVTLTRAFITALEALRLQGRSDSEALNHMMILIDPGVEPVPLLMIRESPYTSDDSLVLGAIAQEVGFVPLFMPEVLAQPPLDQLQDGLMTVKTLIAESSADISPTTDDRPFFFQFEQGLPQSLVPLLALLGTVVAIGAILLVFVRTRAKSRANLASPIYFACLGVGFISVEITLIQQASVFLGQPNIAVAIVLAVLLMGGGIGSQLAGRWSTLQTQNIPAWPAGAMVVAILLWLLLWPSLSQQFLETNSLSRLMITAIAIFPLALLIGIPFPLGLRTVGSISEREVALAWAVNGVMAVTGSAVAVTLAILVGFRSVLIASAAVYALAILATKLGFRDQ
jgi:hypothetical protein